MAVPVRENGETTLFAVVLVANSELLAAMCAAVGQYATTVLC